MQDGTFTVVLTPVQMYAVLTGQTITAGEMLHNSWHGLPSVVSLRRYLAPMPQPSPYTQSWINAHSHLPRPGAPECWMPPSRPLSQADLNRVFGGIELIGATLGLAGGVVMILAPDPTLLSKPAGSILALHSMDSMQAAIRQLYTGKRVTDFTQQGGTWAARRMGASERTANYVGVVLDVAVPLGAGITEGTARLIAIRNGRIITAHEWLDGKPGKISLDDEEAIGKGRNMTKIGGHTLAKHVDPDDAALIKRATGSSTPDAFISKYYSKALANKCANEALAVNRSQIRSFVLDPQLSGTRTFKYYPGKNVGYGFAKGSLTPEDASVVDLVILKTVTKGRPLIILTSYPTK